MNATPRLGLPHLQPAQAAKHVTVNEALGLLDAVVMAAVLSRTRIDPPSNPSEGARYLVPASGANGAWAGFADHFAVCLLGIWRFIAPSPGWRVWVEDMGEDVRWSGSAWSATADGGSASDTLPRLGIGGPPDGTLPLSVMGSGARISADDAPGTPDGARLYLNKTADTDTASLLFQSQDTSRAEFALDADNDLSMRVSDDGANFKDALRIDTRTGGVGIGGDAHPGYVLSVGRETPGIQGLRVRNTDSASGSAAILRMDAANSHYFNIQLYGSGTGYFYSNAALVMGTYAARALSLRTDSVDRLTVHANGCVSVGTGQATAALNVGGAVRIGQAASASLPSASANGAGALHYATDGPGLVVSDGTVWRRVSDGSAV